MRHDTGLKSGLAGYLYRWLRNAGVVAAAMGVWLTGTNLYHASMDGRAEARVTALEIVCVLKGEGLLYRAVTQEVECEQADATRAANANIPHAVREVPYARLSFQSEISADYEARLSLEDLKQPDLQRGDTVAISYSRTDPNEVRAVADTASYLRGLWLLGSGLVMLALVMLARRAVTFESGVDAEVAALERVHVARTAARRNR